MEWDNPAATDQGRRLIIVGLPACDNPAIPVVAPHQEPPSQVQEEAVGVECDTGIDPVLGVTVTTNRADYAAVPPDRGVESVDEQARRKGVRAIESADDLAQEGVFDTDEELDAFLAHVTAMRHADLA